MTQSDMADKGRQKPNRIPVRFDDEGEKPETGSANDSGLTPEELGRESSYEDATEMGRRIESGEQQETGESADDAPGSPDPSELPRSRNDQDTTVSHSDADGQGGAAAPLATSRRAACATRPGRRWPSCSPRAPS